MHPLQRIIFILMILVNQSIFCQSITVNTMSHIGLYGNRNLLLNIDSNLNYKFIRIPFSYSPGFYCEGKLVKIDSNNYALECKKPDSLSYIIESIKVGEIGKNIYVSLGKAPWDIKKRLNSIKVIVGENKYYINKDSNYLYILPTDSVLKYGGFKIHRSEYVISKKINVNIYNIVNHYFISILDYNNCYDVCDSKLGNLIYDKKEYYKIQISNNSNVIFFENKVALKKMINNKNDIYNEMNELYQINYRVILILRSFFKSIGSVQ